MNPLGDRAATPTKLGPLSAPTWPSPSAKGGQLHETSRDLDLGVAGRHRGFPVARADTARGCVPADLRVPVAVRVEAMQFPIRVLLALFVIIGAFAAIGVWGHSSHAHSAGIADDPRSTEIFNMSHPGPLVRRSADQPLRAGGDARD